MSEYSWKEMMAIFFSRDLEDGERICCGAHTEITFAATMLAQKMHAPNIKLQLGGTCFLVNVSDVEVDELPTTSVDYRIVQWAEEYHDHPETFLYFGPPAGRDYVRHHEAYRDTNKYFVGDKFFVGGIQADRYGNVNLIGLRGEHGGFRMRGPGSVGICDIMTVYQSYAFLTAHTPDRLVERVDFVSHPGWDRWREHDHLGYGPKYLVTPKAVFARGRATSVAELKGVFPGNSIDEIRSLTGFPFGIAPDFSEVPPPTDQELAVLRNEIDRKGILRSQ
jgi:glutaconate CoA-transferase subunit B